MAVEPTKLIAAISPDTYCKEGKNKKEVKDILEQAILKKEKDAYLKAAEAADLAYSDFMDFDKVISTPFKLVGLKNPIEQHSATYDTSSQALEQVYYWLHDYLQNNKTDYGEVEKIVDNFLSAPGSAYFSEMGVRAAKMQEEAVKILGYANQLVKAILNIIYDLKEFKLRLEIYDDYKNTKDKTKKRRESAFLSLKQIWLVQVDIKRGNNSIKAMALSGANAPNFVMLIDGFMAANSLEEIKKMDLNDSKKTSTEVRRIPALA